MAACIYIVWRGFNKSRLPVVYTGGLPPPVGSLTAVINKNKNDINNKNQIKQQR